MKPMRATLWRLGLVLAIVGALTALGVPWQRLKVPTLLFCMDHGYGRMRGWAAFKLGLVPTDPKIVVPALLTHLKDKNVYVREMAAVSLGHIHQYPEQVMPALLATLDTEPAESLMSIIYVPFAIGDFGTNARPWSPALVQMIKSNRFNYWTGNALGALMKIDPQAAKPLIKKRNVDYSNGVQQAQAHFDEAARRRALFLHTNVPPANSATSTNASLPNPRP